MGQSTPSTEIRQIELPSHFRKRFFQTICQIICIRNEKLKDKERQQSNATYHSWLQFRNCRHKKPNPLAVGFGINSTNHSSQDFLSAIALMNRHAHKRCFGWDFRRSSVSDGLIRFHTSEHTSYVVPMRDAHISLLRAFVVLLEYPVSLRKSSCACSAINSGVIIGKSILPWVSIWQNKPMQDGTT
jgi:hypothetical protein